MSLTSLTSGCRCKQFLANDDSELRTYLFQILFVCPTQAAFLANDAIVHLPPSNLLSTQCHPDLAAWMSYILQNKPDTSVQVLVTGSLYLVGDVLKHLKKFI